MKKLKLIMALCALLLGWSNASAQTSPTAGAEVATGDYYIYNIATGKYLNKGVAYGTHADVDGAGCVITLSGSTDAFAIHFAGIAADKYFATDGYVDSGTDEERYTTWSFESASVAGYTNVYKIKANKTSTYLYWANSAGNAWANEVWLAATPSGESTYATNAEYWLLIPRATREAYSTASLSNFIDATWRLKDPDFEGRNNGAGEAFTTWTNNGFVIQNSAQAGYSGIFAERWVGQWSTSTGTQVDGGNYHLNDYTQSQSLTDLPHGKYRLTVTAEAVQQETPEEISGALLFAGATTTSVSTRDNYSVDFTFTGTAVEIGFKTVSTTANWVSFDNARLAYIDPYISVLAQEFTSGSTTTADTWYYYSIPTTDDYEFTSSAAGTLTYTTNGNQLLSSATGTAETFTAAQTKELSLSAGRLYFKTDAATTLTVSYKYNVGSATVDKEYIQPGNTVSVTWADASSNDPDASLTKDFSGVTFNSVSISVTPTDNGFTFTVPEGLATGTDYTLAIPASAIGYDEVSLYNAAQNITLTTPAIYDGTYFIKNSGNKYLSRGGSYNTQAIADDKGLPVRVLTNGSNVTEFIFIDNWFHLFDAGNGNLFTDNNSANNFEVQATTGGYYIINKNTVATSTYNGKMYYDSSDGNRVKASTTNSTVWTFETPAAHKTQMQAVKDAQASAVASTAGISASTVDALSSILESDFVGTDISITGTAGDISESYQQGATNQTGNELQIFEETKSGLTPGLYCLTVTAFERITWPDDVYNAKGAPGLTYVYANDEKVQLWSLFDFPSNSKWDNGDKVYDEKYYANNKAGANAAFSAGNYVNKVFVYVTDEGDGTGSITFGINKPHRYGNDGSRGAWICYNNFTLTYYGAVTATIGSKGYTTFSSSYPLDLSGMSASTGTATAYYASANNTTSVTIDETTATVPAGEGLILGGTAGATITIPVATTSGTSISGNLMVGCPTGATITSETSGYENFYVLVNGATEAEFQNINTWVTGGKTLDIPAGKAYLNAALAQQAHSLRLVFGGITGVENIEVAPEATAKNGAYLENGKIAIYKNGQKFNAAGAILK